MAVKLPVGTVVWVKHITPNGSVTVLTATGDEVEIYAYARKNWKVLGDA